MKNQDGGGVHDGQPWSTMVRDVSLQRLGSAPLVALGASTHWTEEPFSHARVGNPVTAGCARLSSCLDRPSAMPLRTHFIPSLARRTPKPGSAALRAMPISNPPDLCSLHPSPSPSRLCSLRLRALLISCAHAPQTLSDCPCTPVAPCAA